MGSSRHSNCLVAPIPGLSTRRKTGGNERRSPMSGPVICGVDWSDESIAAVGVAARLCERLGATLLVAHAVEDSLTFPYGDQAELNRRRHRAHAAMTGLFDRVERRFASV